MDMIKTLLRLGHALVAALALGAGGAWAMVDGITGPTFNLTAKADYITAGDGGSLLAWGYAADDRGPFPGVMQYPGPTLIVKQGDTVTINLKNELPMPVSMVFPGQSGVNAAGGTLGLLTQESTGPADVVTYTFTASMPGTYQYHSGTAPDLQVEMGLVGAIIVRPAGFNEATNRTAYGHPGSAYDHEYLFLLTEMDEKVHQQVAFNVAAGADPWMNVDSSTFFPVYWFINGRAAPDTMFPDHAPWLQTQPYSAMPRMHPGEKLLMRMIGGGRDLHPFHHHGNNTWTIARDGRMLESAAGAGPDLAVSDFTLKVVPGGTYDAIFEWTGKGLGWDIYGTVAFNPHTCSDVLVVDGFDDSTKEWCADHDKPLPVIMPNQQDMTFGGHWSGSPYLGVFGALPPGQGGLNPNAGYFHMWHSHTEKEIANNDIFPGGMMTMVIIEPPGVPIP
jgi:FtsP/CotA-like multicopper oxidase with cupredoxin domain